MRGTEFINERILYVDDDNVLSYKRGIITYKSFSGKKSCNIGGIYNKFSLFERLMRKEPRCAAKINDNQFIISFDGYVLMYSVSDNSISIDHKFSKGMHNPLEFLCDYNPKTKENDIFYGEYIWNINRGPVSIYKRSSNEWNCVYTFPENTITHIHNIVRDKYRNGYIILTGDKDDESGIWFADYKFKKVKPILVGNQQYRACIAFPDENGIYYATDTPLEDNYIYYLKLNKNIEVEDLRKEYEMAGPCIYGCKHGEEMFFSTSVEPDSSLSSWRYRITYKLGRGIKNRYSHIVKRDRDGEFFDILQFKKDIMPIWLFQFGNVVFPKNESRVLYAILQSTSKGHGVTVKIEE